MAEPVVKKSETEEEFKTLIQTAYSGQWAKMGEDLAKEKENELIEPVSKRAKPNQMAAAAIAVVKEQETHEVKPPLEAVKPDHERPKLVHPEYIGIKVKNQDGNTTFFKIRRDSKLKKLLISYCKKHSVHYPSARYLIDGELFNHDKTADEIKLEDETEIEAMVETFGGGEQSFAWISAN